MNKRTRIGENLAYIFIGLVALCLIVTPVFSPAIVVAAMVGTVGGLIAFALGSRRPALVTVVFSLVPLAGLLMIAYAYPRASGDYLVVAPVAAAVIALAVCSIRLLKSAVKPADHV